MLGPSNIAINMGSVLQWAWLGCVNSSQTIDNLGRSPLRVGARNAPEATNVGSHSIFISSSVQAVENKRPFNHKLSLLVDLSGLSEADSPGGETGEMSAGQVESHGAGNPRRLTVGCVSSSVSSSAV